VWEGQLESEPVSITFQIRVSDSAPGFYYAVHNVATLVDLSDPGAGPFKTASALFHIVAEIDLESSFFLPAIFKNHAP
jgi:hypothetical protein